jgi:hypothetical protein
MVWYGMVWYGTVWYGKSIVWHGMGWYEYGMVWKASGWMRVGGISGRQARATVGVGVCGACPVCACVPGRGGGAYTVSQDWSQSLPRNMRGPGEGKGRGGESPPRLSHSLAECVALSALAGVPTTAVLPSGAEPSTDTSAPCLHGTLE